MCSSFPRKEANPYLLTGTIIIMIHARDLTLFVFVSPRILLSIQSEYLGSLTRRAKPGDTVRVSDMSAEVLRHVRDFVYTDRLPADLSQDLLRDVRIFFLLLQCRVFVCLTLFATTKQLAQAGVMCNISDLVQDAQKKGKSRAMADSAMVEKQMKPAMSINELRCVRILRLLYSQLWATYQTWFASDVTFIVGNKRFCLHRAILWSRSTWFRALLSEKWGANSSHTIEVTSMSAKVFAIVVDYLYTSYASSSSSSSSSASFSSSRHYERFYHSLLHPNNLDFTRGVHKSRQRLPLMCWWLPTCSTWLVSSRWLSLLCNLYVITCIY